jgi:hypothetical protein
MTYVFLAAVVLAFSGAIGVCVWVNITQARAAAQERQEHAQERSLWHRERADLIQRIAAPEKAAIDHSDSKLEPAGEQPWLGWDEDAEDPTAGMSKDELAEMVE